MKAQPSPQPSYLSASDYFLVSSLYLFIQGLGLPENPCQWAMPKGMVIETFRLRLMEQSRARGILLFLKFQHSEPSDKPHPQFNRM